MSCHAQKKPQLPSFAHGGLPAPVDCPVPVCLAPEGSWYPLTTPGKFFWGGSRALGGVAGPRGQRPRPLGPSAMASWAPCTAMASWAPCTAMASRAPSSAMVPVCLFCSGGPRPVFLSVSVLMGLQSAHPTPLPSPPLPSPPPTQWNC